MSARRAAPTDTLRTAPVSGGFLPSLSGLSLGGRGRGGGCGGGASRRSAPTGPNADGSETKEEEFERLERMTDHSDSEDGDDATTPNQKMQDRPRKGSHYIHFAPRARREGIRKMGLVPAAKDEQQTLEGPLGFLFLFSITAIHSQDAIVQVLAVLTYLMSYHKLVDAYVVTSASGLEAVTKHEFRTRRRIRRGHFHLWKGCLAFMRRRFAAYDLYLRPNWCKYFWSTQRIWHLRECTELVKQLSLVHTPSWEHKNMTLEEIVGVVNRYTAGYIWFCDDDDKKCKSVYIKRSEPRVAVHIEAPASFFRLETVSTNVRFQSAARLFAHWSEHVDVTALPGYILPPDYYSSVWDVVEEMNMPTRSYYSDGAAYVAFVLRNVLLSWFPEAHFDGWYHDAYEYKFSASNDDQPSEYLLWNFDLPGYFRYLNQQAQLVDLPQALLDRGVSAL